MQTATAQTPKQILADAMAQLSLGIACEFVPWSKSRNAKAGAKVAERSLNWRVTLKHEGRDVLTTDYSAGVGHCPGYRQGSMTLEVADAIKHETETGTAYRCGSVVFRGKPILPAPEDVVYSLVSDSDALDSPNFESWASDQGYDTDSRAAERTYQSCLKIALALRVAVGDAGLQILRNACQDY